MKCSLCRAATFRGPPKMNQLRSWQTDSWPSFTNYKSQAHSETRKLLCGTPTRRLCSDGGRRSCKQLVITKSTITTSWQRQCLARAIAAQWSWAQISCQNKELQLNVLKKNKFQKKFLSKPTKRSTFWGWVCIIIVVGSLTFSVTPNICTLSWRLKAGVPFRTTAKTETATWKKIMCATSQ